MLYYSEKHLTCPIRWKSDACLGNLVYIPCDFISVGPVESSYFLSTEIDLKLSHGEA